MHWSQLQRARSWDEAGPSKYPYVSSESIKLESALIWYSVFLKADTCIASASDPIVLPSNVECDEADYEVELAIIIGKLCKNVSVADAESYILGYATANDVTARQHQERTSQWSYAKGMVQKPSPQEMMMRWTNCYRMDFVHLDLVLGQQNWFRIPLNLTFAHF